MKNLFTALIGCLMLTACGALDESNNLQRQMYEGMKDTEEIIRQQSLAIALEGLLNPINTGVLEPPFRMMPYAESFAEEATEIEIIEIVHTFLQEVYFAPPEAKETRKVSLVALSAIAAFTPLEMVKNIVSTQIDGRGRYEETAYVFLITRYDFNRRYLFGAFLDTAKFLNVGTLVVAVEYFEWLKHVTRLPFQEKLQLKVPSLSVETSMDPDELPFLARKAKRRFKRELTPQDLARPDVQAMLASFDI